MLWAVAFAALPLSAAVASPDLGGLGGLALAGVAVWGLAYALDLVARRREPDGAGAAGTPILAALTVVAMVEGIALGRSAVDGQAAPAVWYAVALAFALAGLAGARRREPGVETLACQLLFHALVVVPALIVQVDFAPLPARADRLFDWAGRAPSASGLVLFGSAVAVVLPALLAMMVSCLARELAGPPRARNLPFAALLDAQLAFIILVARGLYATL
jgi:hypothetical protein